MRSHIDGWGREIVSLRIDELKDWAEAHPGTTVLVSQPTMARATYYLNQAARMLYEQSVDGMRWVSYQYRLELPNGARIEAIRYDDDRALRGRPMPLVYLMVESMGGRND